MPQNAILIPDNEVLTGRQRVSQDMVASEVVLLPSGAQHAWEAVLAKIRHEKGNIFDLYFSTLRLEQIFENIIIFSSPTAFSRKGIRDVYADYLLGLCRTQWAGLEKLKVVERSTGSIYKPLKRTEQHPAITPEGDQSSLQAKAEKTMPRTQQDPPPPEPPPALLPKITLELILKTVCRHYKISKDELLSKFRPRMLTKPRQICAYLAKKLTSASMPQIGRWLGGRDHTTALHSVRKVEQLLLTDEKLREDVETLVAQIRARVTPETSVAS